ncbi:MAG: FAD-linked oxidase C-terminal domain-containing protein [Elusimicrobiota bacterium]|nr:FAD-linked oxidase C-terminal domain-containing protein [Elusimicrobiota bacterium]
MFKQDKISAIRAGLESIVGRENVRTDEAEILMYSYDAGMARARPDIVINFTAAEQVAPVVKLFYGAGIPFLPRLAGTNLSGGTIPLRGGAILNLSRLKKIRQIDTGARLALVEPGVVNLELQKALEPFGFFYAPDPSSQKVSTIGGNVGENAGGPLCLKYGVTSDNVEKLEVVTPQGEVRTWSYKDRGPDLMSVIVGSEGTLGIVTSAWLKILPIPPLIKTASAAFPSLESALGAVTRIIGSGILPRALEAMDKVSMDAARLGKADPFPGGTEAVLIIELDGSEEAVLAAELETVHKICADNACSAFKMAGDEAERTLLWAARKGAYPAMARLAPDVLVEDGVVPRPRLPEALRETRAIISKYKLTAGLLFHAGDGNLHPNILFDRRDIQEVKRVRKAGYEILKSCIRLGGTISGEHGIGVEKRVAMNWLYGREELDFFQSIKRAFDPAGLANPDKILPVATEKAAGAPGSQAFGSQFAGQEKSSVFSGRAALSPAARGILDELRLRSDAGARTAVTGLGTRLKAERIMEGARPLGLGRLSGGAEIDRENLTARVEAGLSFEELDGQLRAAGFYLDLPPLKGSVGGLIASKACPEIRGTLLGLEVALADGSLLELGGKTVKNVAGYDAVRLFCGSLGAYGVIIAATFKLRAGPAPHFGPGTGKSAGLAPAREPLKEAPDWDAFEPEAIHRRLKKEFDPRNLLNPWVYRGEGLRDE